MIEASAWSSHLAMTAELVEKKGELVCRRQGKPDRALSAADVASAISAQPILNEIRANQVTRITAAGRAFDGLPFILRVPGDNVIARIMAAA